MSDGDDRTMTAQQALLEKSVKLASRAQSLVAAHVSHISPEDLSKLQNDCLEAWEKLKEVQTKLVECRKVECAGPDNVSELAIVKAKVKLLEGTTQAYNDAQCFMLPDSLAVRQQILLCDLEKSVSELHDILSYVKGQRQITREQLERETKLELEREQIQDKLSSRLEALRAGEFPQQQPDQPNPSMVAEARKKLDNANSHRQKLMKLIGQFIQEHFPPPRADDVRKWEKKRKISGRTRDVLPLQDIIEELMNKGVTADPYIQTDDRYWPSYIQLLIRTGVVQKDPVDDTRIKMTPFHM